MNIIFFGTPEYAASVLLALLKSKHKIKCVVTQPDRAKGRGLKLGFSATKELALKHTLAIEQPEKIKNNAVFFSLLRSLKPDLIVVVAYGKILPKQILDIPKYGCLNIHASLLPKYRGAAPIQWALLSGETQTGITIMQMDEGLDTGAIITQKNVPITTEDNNISLGKKLFADAGDLLINTLHQIETGKAVFKKQNSALASYAALITKESGEIDWRKDALQIHNRVRAMLPWPVAHTFRHEKILRIWKTQLYTDEVDLQKIVPGVILKIVKNLGFVVGTGAGNILISEVQSEGKKRMPAYNYLIGHDVKLGETLPN